MSSVTHLDSSNGRTDVTVNRPDLPHRNSSTKGVPTTDTVDSHKYQQPSASGENVSNAQRSYAPGEQVQDGNRPSGQEQYGSTTAPHQSDRDVMHDERKPYTPSEDEQARYGSGIMSSGQPGVGSYERHGEQPSAPSQAVTDARRPQASGEQPGGLHRPSADGDHEHLGSTTVPRQSHRGAAHAESKPYKPTSDEHLRHGPGIETHGPPQPDWDRAEKERQERRAEQEKAKERGVAQADYPEQNHTGQVGIGPAISQQNHATFGEKLTGFKEVIVGKLHHDPQAQQHGHEVVTGEAKRHQHEHEDQKLAAQFDKPHPPPETSKRHE